MGQPRKNDDDEIISAFYVLGIDKESAELYEDLLSVGCISYSSCYNERPISKLESYGLLNKDMDAEGNILFWAIDPQIALNAIYSQRLWELSPDERWPYFTNEKKKTIKKIFDAKNFLIKKLYQRKYRYNQNNDQGIKNIPESASSGALSLSINEALKEIVGITSPPYLSNISLIWETLVNRLEQGVRYRRLCDEITLVAFGHEINKRDLKTGVELRVLLDNEITEKFFIIDESEAFIFVPKGPTDGFKSELMQVKIPPIVRLYRDKFDKIWDRGIPGNQMVKFMENLREEFLEDTSNILNDDEKLVLEGIFDYGKFFKANYVDIEKEKLILILHGLHSKDFLIPYSDAELGFLPNILYEVKEHILNNRL